MWRSAETQRVDLRGHPQRDLARDLERAARLAIATGCRRLVIELNGHHGLDAPVVDALGVISELMEAGGGDLLVRRRSCRALERSTAAETRSSRPERARPAVPAKWAA
jgi:hypothetical protein